jgi:hypothetical protein
MAFVLNLYHDQVAAEGASATPLPAAHRLLYIRHGRAALNGRTMEADEARYCADPLTLASTGAWSQVWRWELAVPGAPPLLHQGDGVLSALRMSRVVTSLDLAAGTRWLFRLDRINSAAGRVADRHQHPGPGIRCLVEGTFNVQQDAESARDLLPGDAWWETGSDTVIAWSSPQMAAKFMRGMVLPLDWQGQVTGTWLAANPSAPVPGTWKLYVDEPISL